MFVSRINVLLAEKSRQEKRQVTQGELAKHVGVSRQAINVLASFDGVKNLNADYVEKICEFFDIPLEDYHLIFSVMPSEEGDQALAG
jgi:DNA-binding Xre family transcriptional regulator